MLLEVPVADIVIGERHRKDMGDLRSLAESMRELGLLQPIGITGDHRLVFGERRVKWRPNAWLDMHPGAGH